MLKIKESWNKIKESSVLMLWASHFVNFGGSIIVLPLLLKKFTDVEISFWFLINTMLGLAMLADSGLGPTVIRAVSYFKAGMKELPNNLKEFKASKVENTEPNYEKLSVLLRTTGRVYHYISFLAVFLLSTVGLLFLWNVLSLSGFRIDLFIAYGMIIINSFIMLQTVKWASFMTGLDYVARLSRVKTLLGVFRIMGYIVVLLLGFGIMHLVSFIFVNSIILYFYERRFIRRWFAERRIEITKFRAFDKVMFKSIWAPTWKLGGILWGGYFINYGSSIIIAQINNPALMASFLFTQRLFFIIRRVAEAPFFAHIQNVYTYLAQKDYAGLKKRFSFNIFLSLSLAIVAMVFVNLLGNHVLEFLDIDTRFVAASIFFLMALMYVFEMHAGIHASIYLSTNQVPFLIPSLISGGLIMIGGFLVVPTYGLLGVVLVQILVQLSFNYWYSTMLSLKLLKWPFIQYIKDLGYYGVIGLIDIIKKKRS
jgi:hypothetical protein